MLFEIKVNTSVLTVFTVYFCVMMKTTGLLVFLLMFSVSLFSQSSGPTRVGEEAWFLVLNRAHLSERWSVGNEFHLRRHDFVQQQKQLLVRPWIDYRAGKGFTASFGYSYIRTDPHGESGLTSPVNEHNLWEQVTLSHDPWEQVNFSHRLRLEHRWIDGTEYRKRFRYRLTARFRLAGSWYVHAFNELWVNVNEGIHVSGFDRNWIYAGIGYSFGDLASAELAYLDQFDNGSAGYFNNRGLQVTVSYDLDFREQETD